VVVVLILNLLMVLVVVVVLILNLLMVPPNEQIKCYIVTQSLVLCVCSVDHYLSFFLWPLCCLSILLPFRDSEYPFGISKLFFLHLIVLTKKIFLMISTCLDGDVFRLIL
jgi:hypothetical protein